MANLNKREVEKLYLIYLISEKLNQDSILKSELITDKELGRLTVLELISSYKNKYGVWYTITPKGRLFIKPLESLSETQSELFNIKS